jgi:hypothetical protein
VGSRSLGVRFEGDLGTLITASVELSLAPGVDLCLLKLDASVNLPVFPLTSVVDLGAAFATYGYPTVHGGIGKHEGGTVRGGSSTPDGFKRYELTTKINAIQKGFSGAPLFVHQRGVAGAVVGCISETGSEAYLDAPSGAPLEPLLAHIKKIPTSAFDVVEGEPKRLIRRFNLFMGESGFDTLSLRRAAVSCVAVEDLDGAVRALRTAVGDCVVSPTVPQAVRDRLSQSGFNPSVDDEFARRRLIEALSVAEVRVYVAFGTPKIAEGANDLRRRLVRALMFDRLRKNAINIVAVHARPAVREDMSASLSQCAREAKVADPPLRTKATVQGSPLAFADLAAQLVLSRLNEPTKATDFDAVRTKMRYIWDADKREVFDRENPLP